MPLEPGLCELLRGEAERDAVIHPTRTANLWLMPAGRCDLRSVQALSTSYLGTAIAALCVQFDYVIIDSGPVLKVADSLLVGQHVDAAIVSVLRDVEQGAQRVRSLRAAAVGGHHRAGLGGQRRQRRRGPARRRAVDERNDDVSNTASISWVALASCQCSKEQSE